MINNSLINSLKRPETRLVILGEICFFVLLAVAMVIRPEGLHQNGGISYYGNYDSTWPFYMLGFVLCGLFLLKAGTIMRLANHQTAILATALKIFAILFVGLIVFPSDYSNLTGAIHTTFGSSLFSLQLLISIWLGILSRDWVDYLLVILLIAIGLVCLIALLDIVRVSLEAQFGYQIIFGIILIRGIDRLLSTKRN